MRSRRPQPPAGPAAAPMSRAGLDCRPPGSASRRRAGGGHGDVAAQADQHSACLAPRQPGSPGRTVGPQALGGGPQVKPDAGRQLEQRPVEPDSLPARRWLRRVRRLVPIWADRGKITVVAERDQGVTYGRVHEPSRPSRSLQGDADRLRKPVAEHEQAPVTAMDPGDLRILAEPAGLDIQGGQDAVHRGQRPVELVRGPHRDPGARAQRTAFGDGHRLVAGIDTQPRGGGVEFRWPGAGHQLSR